jgi:Putative metal-binding motif
MTMKTRRPTTTRVLAGLAPFFLIGLALSLMAPSCGDFQPGVKTFAKKSLIIPMDVCYQCTRQSADGLDTATANCTLTGYVSPNGKSCPQALAQGDVMKAYGLVYQLIRNDVAVYWIIDQGKQHVDDYDLSITLNADYPALKYDWAAGGPGQPPMPTGSTIHYMGGPFVVDGSDYDKAVAVMKAYQGTFGAAGAQVNVHVANVAFQGTVAKTMAGGWSAGGTVAPKLALLNIGSGNLSTHGTQATCTSAGDTGHNCSAANCIGSTKNAEPVIEGYLSKAGIGSGTAGGNATGTHGEIYDRLLASDFIPSDFVEGVTLGTPSKTTLFQNGYQVLWVPHWVAPGSCTAAADSNGNIGACACLSSLLTPNKVKAILQTIGAFSAAGKDVFAECAGLGSFEGAFSGLTGTGYTVDYSSGDPSTRFQTKTGVRYNQVANNPFPAPSLTPDGTPNFASPLMQLGDFPFKPYTGAIEDYKPDDTTNADRNYQPNVTRLIGVNYTSGSPAKARDWDFFTYRAPDTGTTAPHGTIVYLAGHSYSGVQGSFQAGGSRLVLNTLFNLGATCTESGVACDTGLPGVCAKGVLKCQGGQRVCVQTVFPTQEICNGLDDDCNGTVDDHLEQGCYDGPASTYATDPACQQNADPTLRNNPANPACRTMGLCSKGVRTCQQNADGSYGYSTCQGQVLPASEVCNGLDDDCNGVVDDLADQACYLGPTDTVNPQTGVPYGACKAGTQHCAGGNWGTCRVCTTETPGTPAYTQCQILPVANPCSAPEAGNSGLDLDCNNQLDVCGSCVNGTSRACYTGPTGTQGVGMCKAGQQTCVAGGWGPCRTCNANDLAQPTLPADCQIVPSPEVCQDGLDQGCHGDLAAAVTPKPGATGPRGSLTNPGQPGTGHDGPPFCNACAYSAGASNSFVPCFTGASTAYAPNPLCSSPTQAGLLPNDPSNPSCVLQGACQAGKRFCQPDGTFAATCEGQKLPGQELCNGKDDDCNGTPDDGAQCGPGFSCENGVCVFATCTAEIPCREGYDCVGGRCTLSSCGSTVCAPGDVCNFGTCSHSCPVDPSVCTPGTICCAPGSSCAGGFCTGGSCYEAGCPTGEVCLAGACVADACASLVCPSGTFCRQGDCVQSCVFSSCAAGQSCDVDGFCVADPCLGKSCGPTQTCAAGACVDDPCVGLACGAGQQCAGGLCVDDPCNGVTCPVGLCRGGQCFSVTRAAGPVTSGPKAKGGCGGCGGGAEGPALLALLALLPLARRRRRSGPGAALLTVALLLAGLGAGCTKKATPFDPASCAASTPARATCEGESRCIDFTSDPSHCGVCGTACAGGEWCVDGVCGPSSAVAPFIASLSPVSRPRGGLDPVVVTLLGDRIAPGATLRATWVGGTVTVPTSAIAGGVTAALDLTHAAAGAWTLRLVNPDLVISNGRAMAVVTPSPDIASVIPVPDARPLSQPPAVSTGGGRTLVLVPSGAAGTGFMVDSACKVGGGTLIPQEVPSTLTSRGLECALDTSSIDVRSDYEVWVENDATHVSAHKSFQVVSVPPTVTSVSPSASRAIPTAIDVFGTGFDLTSKVVISGGAFGAGLDLGTAFVDSGRLYVSQLDLSRCPGTGTACADGVYQITVRNTGLPAATPVPFLIQASVPSVSALQPGSAYQGDQPTLEVTGAAFPVQPRTTIEVRPPGGAFAAIATTGGTTSVRGVLDLIGAPPGSMPAGQYDVRLSFDFGGGLVGASSSFPFRVLSNTALITATPAPPSGAQGALLSVTLSVSNVRPPLAGVSVVFSSGPTVLASLTPTQPQAGQLAVPLDLTGRDTGTYALTVKNPNGAQPSNAASFTVLPGAPTVATVACAADAGCTDSTTVAQRKTPVHLVVTGTNFAKPDAAGNNGSAIHAFTGCVPSVVGAQVTCPCPAPPSTALCVPDYVVPTASVTVTSAGQLDAQLDTTSAPAGTDSVWVWNPGTAGTQRSPAPYKTFTITP